MERVNLPGRPGVKGAGLLLIVLLTVLLGAEFLAFEVQTDFGKVKVSNVIYPNYNGIPVRAKLFRPMGATNEKPAPGVVYIHGYQNNRETGDAYALELARRGFVVLNIDAIGRGNSGSPGPPDRSDFDPTYGGKSSFEYLQNLPYVDAGRVGMMGHSLGAEMAYHTALEDPRVSALVITGFAFDAGASAENPKNMLMIMGKYDEYRRRMTGVEDIEKDWMSSSAVRKAIPAAAPELNRTYGDFSKGTARRVFIPRAIHIQVSHNHGAVVEALLWMKQSLNPPDDAWVDPNDQIWPLKEWSTLAALIAGIALLLPIGVLLLAGPFKTVMNRSKEFGYFCSWGGFFKAASINAVLEWLYLPLIFLLFGIHIYVIRIDLAFPMMLLNAIVWWFFIINLAGYLIRKRWANKNQIPRMELGLGNDTGLGGAGLLILDCCLALTAFGLVYGLEHLLESIFIVDYRFIFPFASDLTPHRALICLLYLPFFYFGFYETGVFWHGRIRRPVKQSFFGAWFAWSTANALVLIIPLVILLLVQYAPLLLCGVIVFEGPGGMLASFVMNIFHIVGVLALVAPISTWFFILTGRIRPGAMIVSLLTTWMMVSSQVIAPIPV